MRRFSTFTLVKLTGYGIVATMVLYFVLGGPLRDLALSFKQETIKQESASSNPKPVVEASKPSTPEKLPTVIRLGPSRPSGINPTTTTGGAIAANRIEVVDGDTIRIDGTRYRLVGFNTPESGDSAKCPAERQLAERATRRMRELVAAGGLQFNRVACACEPGTEGTFRCDFGRLCGVLTAGGRDVGLILMGEGLAKRYICGATSCPAKDKWC